MSINPSESVTSIAQLALTNIHLQEENCCSEDFLRSIFDSVRASIFVVDVLEDDFQYVALNPAHEAWTGISSSQIKGKKPEDILCADDATAVRERYAECVRYKQAISYEQCLHFQGICSWWKTSLTPLFNEHSQVYRLIGISTNITQLKDAELELRHSEERSLILQAVAQSVLQLQDLETIFQLTVSKLCEFLQCDRVVIYQFDAQWGGEIVIESRKSSCGSILGREIKDSCFLQHIEPYKRGRIQAVENIYAAGLHPCYINLLSEFGVQANLVVPILARQDLWGLLIAHHCQKSRQWHSTQIDLLKQLAIQLGIAIQQLPPKDSCLEDTVLNITETIRSNLDETQALQLVTKELVRLLELDGCQIELYDSSYSQATVVCEQTNILPRCRGMVREIAEFPTLYQALLQKQPVQFPEILAGWNLQFTHAMQLAYPIFDVRGVLGNLRLTRITEKPFDERSLRLVEILATQCAIAIRQGRLYQATQQQAKEIKRLERLKQEFLRNLSHELRTPITSITLAAQTLESVLKQEGVLEIEIVPQLLQILDNECGRESKLINDLIALTYLEADTRPASTIPIDLQSWLTPIVESFRERMNCQQQILYVNISKELPLLQTDVTDLERIINELLNNACKFTPPEETIQVAAFATEKSVVLRVSNSGVNIAQEELVRMFEPFYRIPNNDPWKFGGSGLGLALVKKLVKHLGGNIWATATYGKICFVMEFTKG